jgi:hypothetical protein
MRGKETQSLTDGELYYIIRITGHSEVMLQLLRRGLTSGWIFVI